MRSTESSFILTADQAAAMLGTGIDFVAALARRRQIKSRRINPTRRLYCVLSVAQYILRRDAAALPSSPKPPARPCGSTTLGLVPPAPALRGSHFQ